jgi:hypothetical membrane protein
MHSTRQIHLGALAWVLCLVFFVGQVAAQLAFVPTYSLIDDRISDLGNTACGPWLTRAYACSPLHDVMNASLLLTGVLLIVGALLTRHAWPRRRLSTWGLVVLALAGAGFVVVGLNPENVNLRLHLLGASNLVLSNLGVLLMGLACWRDSRSRATFSLALAGLGFSGLLLGPVLIVLTGHGGGIGERLALYPIVVWLVCVGVALTPQAHRAADRAHARPGNACSTSAKLRRRPISGTQRAREGRDSSMASPTTTASVGR